MGIETATEPEKDIKNAQSIPPVGEGKHKVLIATLYNPDPVMLAVTRLGPDKLILIFDKEPNKELSEALSLIKSSLGKVIEVEEVRTEAYDIVEVARKCVEVIDRQGKDDLIFANITSGRKTRAIGLLFACYARHDQVTKIAYNPEEDKKAIVWLPRLSFKLTDNQKELLEKVESGTFKNTSELADKMKISPAMVYRAIGELEDQDFIVIDEDGLRLTDAGKIARM